MPMKKLAGLIIVFCLMIVVAYWKIPGAQLSEYHDFNAPLETPKSPIEPGSKEPQESLSDEDLAAPVAKDDYQDMTGTLELNEYVKAVLVDNEISQTTTLRISGITESKGFVQYTVESADGETGVVTVSPERVFAFLQTKNGVYEYSGDELELRLNKSFMSGVADDIKYPKTKTPAR